MRPFYPVLLPALLLPSLAGAQTSPEVPNCTPDVTLRPLIGTHTVPPYPMDAIMAGETGAVLLDVTVGIDGKPVDVTVAAGGNSPGLNVRARDHVKNVWRWEPVPHTCRTKVQVTFNIGSGGGTAMPSIAIVNPRSDDYPPLAREKNESGITAVAVFTNAKGDVIDVQVTHTSGSSELDRRSLQLAREQHLTPAMLDGKPVVTVVPMAFHWGVP